MATKQLKQNQEALQSLVSLTKKGYTDKEVQQRLFDQFGIKWSLATIRRNRISQGINKKEEIQLSQTDSIFFTAPPLHLNSEQQAEWFREQFQKTYLYEALKTQLTQEEIKVYIEEYGNVCCQFKDIVTSEYFQIDDFLKHRILINRQLTLIKSLENDIKDISLWLDNHPFDSLDSKEEKQSFMQKQKMLSDLRKEMDSASNRYDKLVKERKAIFDNLGATRRDRLDDLRGGKQDFFTLVAEIQTSQERRDEQGKLAELSKIALEDAEDAMHKPIKFDDGSIDPMILDSEFIKDEDI